MSKKSKKSQKFDAASSRAAKEAASRKVKPAAVKNKSKKKR